MSKRFYPCDAEPFECPFNARYSNDCRYYCGLGVDEDEPEDYETYAEPEYTSEQLESDPIAIEGAKWDDLNYQHYMER